MFYYTAKITSRKVIVAVMLILLPVCIAVSSALAAERETPELFSRIGETAEERTSFLCQFGWKTEAACEQEETVTLPAVFDEVYAPYQEIQLAQGFDLSPYLGQTVRRYTRAVQNYPDRPQRVYATLLVCDGLVIGGDIHLSDQGGFLHGFYLPDTGLTMGQLQTAASDAASSAD